MVGRRVRERKRKGHKTLIYRKDCFHVRKDFIVEIVIPLFTAAILSTYSMFFKQPESIRSLFILFLSQGRVCGLLCEEGVNGFPTLTLRVL